LVKKTVPTLRLTPQKSIVLLSFILIAHTGAMGVILLLPLELWMQLFISLVVIISLIQALRTHILRANGSTIKSAEWDSEGEWRLFTVNGDELAAQLKASSYVQPWFIVLNFSINRFGRRNVILLPDSVDPELLRHLRVRLKLLSGTNI